jgi:hypothetical protein
MSQWVNADMFVPAGSPRTLVLSLHGGGSPAPQGVWVYDDDQPRTKGIQGGWQGATWIEPGSAPDEVLALGESSAVLPTIRQYQIVPDGLRLIQERPYSGHSFALAAAGETMLLWPAEVYSASTLDRLRTYPYNLSQITWPSLSIGLRQDGKRAVVAALRGATIRLEEFCTDTLAPVAVSEVPLYAEPRALAFWEEDGIALLAGHSLILGRLGAHFLDIRQFDERTFRVIFPADAGRRWTLSSAASPSGPWAEVAQGTSSGGMQMVPVEPSAAGTSFYKVIFPASQQ